MADNTIIDLLVSIDASMKSLLVILAAQATAYAPSSTAPQAGRVATEAELDGKWGNPILKAKDPRDWTGAPCSGRLMSECPPEYLDMVADRAEYFAQKNDAENVIANNGKPKSAYDRMDAARARGWAARKRAGWVDPASDAGVSGSAGTDGRWDVVAGGSGAPVDDEIPF